MRRCVFCGGEPCTKEHVYRNDRKKHLPAEAGYVSYNHRELDRREVAGMSTFDQQVKRVCGPCNTGWMRLLEDEVDKTLVPMMTDQSIVAGKQRARVLARWAAKTTVMRSFMASGGPPFKRESLDAIFTGRRAPKSWLVSIGRYHESDIHDRITAGGNPEGGDDRYLYQHSLILGRFVVVVLAIDADDESIDSVHNGFRYVLAQTGTNLKEIWPATSGITWPPSPVISQDQFQAVGHFAAGMVSANTGIPWRGFNLSKP